MIGGFLAVVLVCCGGAGAYFHYKDRWLQIDGLDGPSGTLDVVAEIQLPDGAKAGAATSDGSTLYYAYSGSDARTTVIAKSIGSGGHNWKSSVPDIPDDARLTVVEDLLLVELSFGGGRGAHRSVLSTKDGSKLSEDTWPPNQREVIARVGTDLILSKLKDRKAYVERLDLRTGTTKWSREITGRVLSIGRQATVGYVWPNGQQPAAQPFDGFADYLGDKGERFRTSAGADISTIVVDDDEENTYVIDGETGQVKVSGKTGRKFTQVVLAGTLVAYSSQGSRGGVLTGYDITTLKQRWQTPLPEAGSIARPQPCAPKVVCVDAGDATQGLIVPIDVETGKAAADLRTMAAPAGKGTTFSPSDWTVLDKRVLGTSITQTGVARSVDPWDVTQARRSSLSMKSYAAQGHTAIVEAAEDPGWPGTEYGYYLFALNVETLEYTTPVFCEFENLPQDVDVFGDVVTIVTGSRKVIAARISF
ncbi:hypothetical protein Val02_41530 [Virgisporangium aliadipatigenens]|uniref:Uncharacterized protein n=1 Tax=Virgisporangium aliadipatigenens TaxID=741659 RepID=A0A8J3YMS9_9ACTN|nr:hypothetical protein Val02_41530 [Virgisporangium aliadipatigenens]